MSPEPLAGLDSQTRDHAKEWRMPDDATATGISDVGTVFVPVSDQDRSLEFFVDQLGFEKRADFLYGGRHRWIEVAPPGAANAIGLVPPSEGASAGATWPAVRSRRPTSRVRTRPCVPEASMSTR